MLRFEVDGCLVVEFAMESSLVEPVDPAEDCPFDIADGLQRAVDEWTALADRFGLARRNQRLRLLGERVATDSRSTHEYSSW